MVGDNLNSPRLSTDRIQVMNLARFMIQSIDRSHMLKPFILREYLYFILWFSYVQCIAKSFKLGYKQDHIPPNVALTLPTIKLTLRTYHWPLGLLRVRLNLQQSIINHTLKHVNFPCISLSKNCQMLCLTTMPLVVSFWDMNKCCLPL